MNTARLHRDEVDRRRRAQRARYTEEARRELQEARRRAEEVYRRAQNDARSADRDARRTGEDAGRRMAGHEARTYRSGGRIVANYYDVLEVSPKARQSVIDKAYRTL
jgi:membrane protein involved in colicin uptake